MNYSDFTKLNFMPYDSKSSLYLRVAFNKFGNIGECNLLGVRIIPVYYIVVVEVLSDGWFELYIKETTMGVLRTKQLVAPIAVEPSFDPKELYNLIQSLILAKRPDANAPHRVARFCINRFDWFRR